MYQPEPPEQDKEVEEEQSSYIDSEEQEIDKYFSVD
jgi:hypothetical protein